MCQGKARQGARARSERAPTACPLPTARHRTAQHRTAPHCALAHCPPPTVPSAPPAAAHPCRAGQQANKWRGPPLARSLPLLFQSLRPRTTQSNFWSAFIHHSPFASLCHCTTAPPRAPPPKRDRHLLRIQVSRTLLWARLRPERTSLHAPAPVTSQPAARAVAGVGRFPSPPIPRWPARRAPLSPRLHRLLRCKSAARSTKPPSAAPAPAPPRPPSIAQLGKSASAVPAHTGLSPTLRRQQRIRLDLSSNCPPAG